MDRGAFAGVLDDATILLLIEIGERVVHGLFLDGIVVNACNEIVKELEAS